MRVSNRRARRDYQIFESLEAGIALSGGEVKSIKQGRGDLTSAYIRIKDGEAWLVGANIPRFAAVSGTYDTLRDRKLLLHKEEIVSLATRARQERLTLLPLALYTKGPRIKVQLALARGRKKYEKREAIKRREIEREVARELRGK